MNTNEAIKKLRVMLGFATEDVVEIKENIDLKFEDAELVDGTSIYTETTIEAGAVLYIKIEDGEDILVPEGMVETTKGLVIHVGPDGVIISTEETATDKPVAEDKPAEVAIEASNEFTSEEFLAQISDLISPYNEKLDEIKKEMATLKSEFQTFSDEPAAKPIRNSFSREAMADKQSKFDARIEQLVAIRQNK